MNRNDDDAIFYKRFHKINGVSIKDFSNVNHGLMLRKMKKKIWDDFNQRKCLTSIAKKLTASESELADMPIVVHR